MKHGVDVRRPWLKNQGEISDAETVKKLSAYITKSFGFELSAFETKEGKKKSRLSLYQYLLKLSKMPEDAGLEKEYHRVKELFRALKGLNKVVFSQGLRAFCGLQEVSDDEILEGKKGTKVFSFDTDKDVNWESIAKSGRKGHVLQAFDDGLNGDTAFAFVSRGFNPLTGEELKE